ncbi:protein MAINTENANCE OF MERISTEMS-like [Papaver somniferum]|uniref:protein MAINTENANCE OF MERISTEMS-like n=1 Tax=Papaver somniferum TaxID=3469 RepID=UPI000E700005|nr:protein MAINTENANCE OF MERISTEMS-like [Papaver somniferum]
MTITPNGAKFITGISIDGKSVKQEVYAQELERDKIYAFTKNVFQWDEEMTKSQMLGKEVTKECIFATDNAYVLYILGSVIFPDFSGARVSANFIHLLQPFDKIHEFSWGTAILAHSLNGLRKASRTERNQIGGNMAFLQAWIYLHFPIFAERDFENKELDGNFYGDMYTYNNKEKSQDVVYLKFRRQLDNFTTNDDVFEPYKKDLAQGKGKMIKCAEQQRLIDKYPRFASLFSMAIPSESWLLSFGS